MAASSQYGRRRRRGGNRRGMIGVTIILAAMVIFTIMGTRSQKAKKASFDAQIAVLTEQIEGEEKRAEELQEFAKYAKTKAYYEEIARERLGLVYPDEIIFKQE